MKNINQNVLPNDTKTVARNCKSKKDMYYNKEKDKVKWTSNDIQNTTQKTKIVNLLYDLYIDVPLIDNVYLF